MILSGEKIHKAVQNFQHLNNEIKTLFYISELNKNEEMMRIKQEEYASKLKKQQEEWELKFKNLEDGVDSLNDVVKVLKERHRERVK